MGPFGPHVARSLGPPGPCRGGPAGRTLSLLVRHLGGRPRAKGAEMRSMRRGWRAVGTLAFISTALTGGAVFGLASASQAASANATTSAAAASAGVTAPGISAPSDVVVGAADGSVQLKVTLNAPGVNPVTVNYTTVDGTTHGGNGCSGTFYGYTGQSGTLTFQPGVTSQTIRVPLLNCGASLASGFQEFTLNLSNNSS